MVGNVVALAQKSVRMPVQAGTQSSDARQDLAKACGSSAAHGILGSHIQVKCAMHEVLTEARFARYSTREWR